MKQLIFSVIIFAVATLHGYAQNVAGNFLPRANDEVKRQQVAYVAADEGAEDMLWDFRQLDVTGRRANQFVTDYNNYIYIHHSIVYPY